MPKVNIQQCCLAVQTRFHSFQLRKCEIFGLVGESGSGKSTAAKCIMNILHPTAGKIRYLGINTCDPRQFRSHKKFLQISRQIIFQDSTSSLNPRMTVADIITEPLMIHHIRPPRGSLRAEAAYQLKCVGMDPGYLDKHPAELSGGELQRFCIARALGERTQFILADEISTMLDLITQSQIWSFLVREVEERGIGLLAVSHSTPLLQQVCTRVEDLEKC